ncbi:hypothetical protein F8M41_001540 [Gigaspora margarita]|uniref:F-box domain-containing protein n=1 Tax=Gigaspora margarita TaxID=4874 RepID=A0A8H4ESL8_GIGMA|nr:hypothetical protein F8M41_001540 [Gigaspora margarita]
MITLLPLECYHKIINNFRDDSKDLLSCALVNRHLSRFTMPILWNEPGHHFKNKKLINILFSMLNDDEQNLLNGVVTVPNQPAPLFEYTTFIKSVPANFYSGVRKWAHAIRNRRRGLEDKYEEAIKYSLIRMFLRTGQNIKYLYLENINCDDILFKDTEVTSVDLYFLKEVKHKFVLRSINGLVKNLFGGTFVVAW